MDGLLQKLQAGEISVDECKKALATQVPSGAKNVQFKVTPKGCVGFYGLRSRPITLYIGELERILAAILKDESPEYSEQFQNFIDTNNAQLSKKEE